MMRPVLFAAALLAGGGIHAQNALQRTLNNDTMPNLVPNPGFEEYKQVPCYWTQQAHKFNDDVMVGWSSPTETTPDLYSTKADADCWTNPSKRTGGKAAPHSGNAMVGIKVRGKGNTPTYWHEYLQITLPEPLAAGTRYIVECWALRANFSEHASNNIGLYLSPVAVKTTNNLPLYFTPHVNADEIVKGNRWKKISGVVEAKGDERYLLIGNFYSDEATAFEQQEKGERGAYYFIDDVNIRVAPPGTAATPRPKESVPPPPKTVVADHASTKEVPLPRTEPPAVGKSVRLDNIGFEFGKAALTPDSKQELDELADMLIDYPRMRIEVEGHTDDIGSDAFNLQLSEDRAKAVVEFLRKRKVEKERITWKGYGKTKPLVPNTSEENRALNRRVEFRVIGK
ncbi:MAG TPA: OmpA family protein [Flavobacteriales bacterium]|nr:OmpA family protein [Flavobacteriales bacterium]